MAEVKKRSAWTWLKWVAIGLALLLMGPCLLLSVRRPANGAQDIPLSDFRHVLLADGVQAVSIDGDTLSGKFRSPTVIVSRSGTMVSVTKFETELPAGTCNWQFVQWLLENAGNARIDVATPNNFVTQMVVPLIPWILIFVFVAYFLRRNVKAVAALREQPTKVIILNPESKQ